ncbi:MAG TPA: IS481 family transposase [Thermoanaerobaculia bacterium]|nr:IS481 family transposase [Thermoanaerobaculia bacterium]
MDIHKNARSCPASRLLLIHRVVVERMPVGEAAEQGGMSRRRATEWIRRYREGDEELCDRSSRPNRSPGRTPERVLERVRALRQRRLTALEIARVVGLSKATVARHLQRTGMSRLKNVEPAEPVRRYEKKRPGEMLHLDTKKLGRIGRIGHRITGDRRSRVRGIGWEFVHVAIDDYSRVSYVEVLPNERAPTTAAFLSRAAEWFALRGVQIETILTDNGGNYRSKDFAAICSERQMRHRLTRPYRPCTNGKAERFIQTLLRDWAYKRPYRTSYQRTKRLETFVRYYNQQRPHASLNQQPPVSRLSPSENNVLRNDT